MELRTNLDDLDLVARLDPSGMIDAVDHFSDPLIAREYQSERELRMGGFGFRSLVLMGMGGSASAGDVVLDWLRSRLRVPAFVHREPSLPAFVNSKTLFVAISYSGETIETLAALKAAKARRARLIGIGTGGKLATLCDRYRAPFLQVDTTVAPRAALTQLVVATSIALESLGVVPSTSFELQQARRELLPLRNRSRVATPLEMNPAKRLALKLRGHFLVLYSLQRMSSVARRFKNQLAENSKEVAKYEGLPESCHNEIEAWRNSPNHSLPVLIRDSKESSLERPIVEAFRSTVASVLDSRPVNVQVQSQGVLSRLLCPILFLDYVSVYLALLKRVDPTPTKLIARYKAALKH
jgi:glucose/mannose-6-phosphate isomerase